MMKQSLRSSRKLLNLESQPDAFSTSHTWWTALCQFSATYFTESDSRFFRFQAFHSCVTSIAQLVSQSRHSKKIRTPHCIDSTFPSMDPHMQTIRTLSPWSKIIAVLIVKPLVIWSDDFSIHKIYILLQQIPLFGIYLCLILYQRYRLFYRLGHIWSKDIVSLTPPMAKNYINDS